MYTIDISSMSKADVLAKLFNRSKPVVPSLLRKELPKMTTNEAQKIIDSGHLYFDVLRGRLLSVNISGDRMYAGLYDCINGKGAAAAALGVKGATT